VVIELLPYKLFVVGSVSSSHLSCLVSSWYHFL